MSKIWPRWQWLPCWRTHGGCVKSIKISERTTCLGFFQHWNFGCFCWLFYFIPYVKHIKSFVWPAVIFKTFSFFFYITNKFTKQHSTACLMTLGQKDGEIYLNPSNHDWLLSPQSIHQIEYCFSLWLKLKLFNLEKLHCYAFSWQKKPATCRPNHVILTLH